MTEREADDGADVEQVTGQMAVDSELAIRLAAFVGVLAAMAALEALLPKRQAEGPRAHARATNLAMAALDALMLRFGFPILAVGVAAWGEAQDLGLLALIDAPRWLEAVVAVAVLDLAIWAQHWASHRVPLLWRLHMVHHADRHVDVTTGLRFHPGEAALSMLWKFAVIVALGASPVAVMVFEVLLSALAMFNHANVALPRRADALLRLVIVTPDMHRVHHSVERAETDSNYGFNLAVWDRLFGTYRAEPGAGHGAMTLGLPQWRGPEPGRLGWSLMLPLRGRGGRAALGGQGEDAGGRSAGAAAEGAEGGAAGR